MRRLKTRIQLERNRTKRNLTMAAETGASLAVTQRERESTLDLMVALAQLVTRSNHGTANVFATV